MDRDLLDEDVNYLQEIYNDTPRFLHSSMHRDLFTRKRYVSSNCVGRGKDVKLSDVPRITPETLNKMKEKAAKRFRLQTPKAQCLVTNGNSTAEGNEASAGETVMNRQPNGIGRGSIINIEHMAVLSNSHSAPVEYLESPYFDKHFPKLSDRLKKYDDKDQSSSLTRISTLSSLSASSSADSDLNTQVHRPVKTSSVPTIPSTSLSAFKVPDNLLSTKNPNYLSENLTNGFGEHHQENRSKRINGTMNADINTKSPQSLALFEKLISAKPADDKPVYSTQISDRDIECLFNNEPSSPQDEDLILAQPANDDERVHSTHISDRDIECLFNNEPSSPKDEEPEEDKLVECHFMVDPLEHASNVSGTVTDAWTLKGRHVIEIGLLSATYDKSELLDMLQRCGLVKQHEERSTTSGHKILRARLPGEQATSWAISLLHDSRHINKDTDTPLYCKTV